MRLPAAANWCRAWPAPKTQAPAAKPDGYIAKDLSANGEHLIFGSTSSFAAGGNDGTGDVSIYDRNLKTGETHVVSNTPGGDAPLPCLQQGAGECHSPGDANGIAELDVSSDGSHILLGQKVSTDADGNVYWHLYMDIGDSIKTIDLTPGATHGVLFDGMTADGSKVFFTTKDALHTATNQDTDTSADIYQAEVSEAGALTLTRISTGIEGTGNTDACDPVSNADGDALEHGRLRRQLRRRSDRRRWGSGRRRRLDLLPLPREARRSLQRHRRPAQPLRRPPRLSARSSSPPSTPTTRWCSMRSRKPEPARPPTSRSPRAANSPSSPRPCR